MDIEGMHADIEIRKLKRENAELQSALSNTEERLKVAKVQLSALAERERVLRESLDELGVNQEAKDQILNEVDRISPRTTRRSRGHSGGAHGHSPRIVDMNVNTPTIPVRREGEQRRRSLSPRSLPDADTRDEELRLLRKRLEIVERTNDTERKRLLLDAEREKQARLATEQKLEAEARKHEADLKDLDILQQDRATLRKQVKDLEETNAHLRADAKRERDAARNLEQTVAQLSAQVEEMTVQRTKTPPVAVPSSPTRSNPISSLFSHISSSLGTSPKSPPNK